MQQQYLNFETRKINTKGTKGFTRCTREVGERQGSFYLEKDAFLISNG